MCTMPKLATSGPTLQLLLPLLVLLVCTAVTYATAVNRVRKESSLDHVHIQGFNFWNEHPLAETSRQRGPCQQDFTVPLCVTPASIDAVHVSCSKLKAVAPPLTAYVTLLLLSEMEAGSAGQERLNLLSPSLLDPLRRRLFRVLDACSLRSVRATSVQLWRELNSAVTSVRLNLEHLKHVLNLHVRFPRLEELVLCAKAAGATPEVHSAASAARRFAAQELPLLTGLRSVCIVPADAIDQGRLLTPKLIASPSAAIAAQLLACLACEPLFQPALAQLPNLSCLEAYCSRLPPLLASVEAARSAASHCGALGRTSPLQRLQLVFDRYSINEESADDAYRVYLGYGLKPRAGALEEWRALVTALPAARELRFGLPEEMAGPFMFRFVVATLSAVSESVEMLALGVNFDDPDSEWRDTFSPPARPPGDVLGQSVLSFTSLELGGACEAELLCELLHNQPAIKSVSVGELRNLRGCCARRTAAPDLCCLHVETLVVRRHAVYGNDAATKIEEDMRSTRRHGSFFRFPNLTELRIGVLEGGEEFSGLILVGSTRLQRLVLPAGCSLVGVRSPDPDGHLLRYCSMIRE